MEHVSVHGVWSTQNAYACAKQMKSKRQTDKYYSLHLYIYSRLQHWKHHRRNANVYDSQHQTRTKRTYGRTFRSLSHAISAQIGMTMQLIRFHSILHFQQTFI